MKNYTNNEKLTDDFLIERNHADLKLHFLHIGADIVVIHEKHNLN